MRDDMEERGKSAGLRLVSRVGSSYGAQGKVQVGRQVKLLPAP
jgi:hypothetical protein